MQKTQRDTPSPSVETKLYYSPENNSFRVDKNCPLTIEETDPWIVMSIKGGAISKPDLLLLLRSRGRHIRKSRRSDIPPEMIFLTVALPIRVLEVVENRIISFQLTAPVYAIQ